MKIAIEKQTSDNNLDGAQSFSIEQSAIAFEALSSGIYQNLIESMVRELISNANDGHVKKGNLDVPFKVHCPTINDPNFIVKDFGSGMNKEMVTEVYTKYFCSTKTDSNTEVGGFGLGAKIPIAYTDQYSIESVYDGIKSLYQVVKENGIPSLYFINSEKTSEPSGVTITVPVNVDDIKQFATAINFYYVNSTFNFEVDGCEVDDRLELMPFYDIPGTWKCPRKMADSDRPRDVFKDANLKVRIGGVPYNIDLDDFCKIVCEKYKTFKELGSEPKLRQIIQKAKKGLTEQECQSFDELFENQYINEMYWNGYLDVEIGQLSVTRSREAVQTSEQNAIELFSILLNRYFQIYSKTIQAMKLDQPLTFKDLPNLYEEGKNLMLLNHFDKDQFEVKFNNTNTNIRCFTRWYYRGNEKGNFGCSTSGELYLKLLDENLSNDPLGALLPPETVFSVITEESKGSYWKGYTKYFKLNKTNWWFNTLDFQPTIFLTNVGASNVLENTKVRVKQHDIIFKIRTSADINKVKKTLEDYFAGIYPVVTVEKNDFNKKDVVKPKTETGKHTREALEFYEKNKGVFRDGKIYISESTFFTNFLDFVDDKNDNDNYHDVINNYHWCHAITQRKIKELKDKVIFTRDIPEIFDEWKPKVMKAIIMKMVETFIEQDKDSDLRYGRVDHYKNYSVCPLDRDECYTWLGILRTDLVNKAKMMKSIMEIFVNK